jgi:hypothetical protein
MKKTVMALLLTCTTLSASGQFFSEEEKSAKEKDKQAEEKTSLPEAEQKAVFIEVIEARTVALHKANKMYPVKIHQTPEQREERKQKAEQTRATLMTHYKSEIAKKHLISGGYLAEIMKTGREKQWPKAESKPEEK